MNIIEVVYKGLGDAWILSCNQKPRCICNELKLDKGFHAQHTLSITNGPRRIF